jgi:hypothetical protein
LSTKKKQTSSGRVDRSIGAVGKEASFSNRKARWSAMPQQINTSGIVRVDTSKFNTSATELLVNAQASLRGVMWGEFGLEDFLDSPLNSDEGKNRFYNRSRFCKYGSIDAFVSHSWRDDPTAKFTALGRWCDRFQKNNYRWPMLWIDKFCIDQENISDGLKCLPVSVMGCEKFLVLWGDSYIHRLWCVWELYMLLVCSQSVACTSSSMNGSSTGSMNGSSTSSMSGSSTSSMSGSNHRSRSNGDLVLSLKLEVMVSALEQSASERSANKHSLQPQLHSHRSSTLKTEAGAMSDRVEKAEYESSKHAVAQKMDTFDVACCGCFDPNDEARVLHVIAATGDGVAGFNAVMQRFGGAMANAVMRPNSGRLQHTVSGSFKMMKESVMSRQSMHAITNAGGYTRTARLRSWLSPSATRGNAREEWANAKTARMNTEALDSTSREIEMSGGQVTIKTLTEDDDDDDDDDEANPGVQADEAEAEDPQFSRSPHSSCSAGSSDAVDTLVQAQSRGAVI